MKTKKQKTGHEHQKPNVSIKHQPCRENSFKEIVGIMWCTVIAEQLIYH